MDRYVVQQPMTLESLAEAELSEWITTRAHIMMALYIKESLVFNETKAEGVLSQQLQRIRKYLGSNMPWKFHNAYARKVIHSLEDLLQDIEKTFSSFKDSWERNIRVKIIGRVLEAVMTENLTSLSLDQRKLNHITTFMPTLLNKSDMLSNLTHLDLIYLQNIDTKHLLKHLNKLKSLSLSCNLCTLDLIRCLAHNCKLLESLDFVSDYENYECFFPREIFSMLCQLLNLKRLYLQAVMGYSVSSSIKELLLSCGDLENINIDRVFTFDATTHVYDDEIAIALKEISKELPEKRFKIKHYTLREDTTLEQFQLVVQMCPLIERVSIVVYEQGLSLPLQLLGSILNQLPNLRELELQNFYFYRDSINEILILIGFKLVELCLYTMKNIDLMSLQCISQTCPNLESLQIRCFFETEYKYDLGKGNMELNIVPFRHLLNLSFCGYSNAIDGTRQLAFYLLSSCPNVEYVHMAMHILTESLILRVLDKISLTNLRELKLETVCCEPDTEVTPVVIQKLVQNCVNPLVVVISRRS